MSATNAFSPTLAPAAPVRSDWRGRLAGWLARMNTRRQQKAEEAAALYLADRLNRDLRLPPGPTHEDRVWGAGGLISR
ncbi:hypothetical protein J8J14_24020 [Roseomonas sp. SSH11]|uniref:Uncharacterized protein n=1 Tax=Pararoseomonas baculiformis TaxID=2820812 RepID=A0ABS4ALC1_9PROT|nr:hypothetical protein [Pararoseomonas baculiformis]MBP0447813.1 hypothetical protein [Pararoseomonas baculiformis]